MSIQDVKSKEYLKENRRFADLVNGTVFGGDQVVSAENLTEVDTAEEIVVPTATTRRWRSSDTET